MGHVWRFESYRYRRYYMRHVRSWVIISRHRNSRLYDMQSQWQVVKGLCGYGISFRSKRYPRYYLRHRGYKARLHRYRNTRLFKLDACFIPRRGLASRRGFSFESVNFRGYYLRQRNRVLRIDRKPRSYGNRYRRDATFLPILTYP